MLLETIERCFVISIARGKCCIRAWMGWRRAGENAGRARKLCLGRAVLLLELLLISKYCTELSILLLLCTSLLFFGALGYAGTK